MVRYRTAISFFVLFSVLGRVQQLEAATLTLAWNHSPDTNVAGYLISYGTNSGKYTTNVKAGRVTTVSVTGLTDGGTYYFSVQSFDSNGVVGPPAPEVVGRAPSSSPQAVSVSCPSPVLTSPDGKSMSVTLTPTVSGGLPPITTTCTPSSGSQFGVGSTSFTCNAVDGGQQKASCTSVVRVLTAAPAPAPPPPPPAPVPPAPPTPTPPTPAPPTPPPPSAVPPAAPSLTLSCPQIAPVIATGNTGRAKVTFPNPTYNGGTGSVTIACGPKSGSFFDVGNTAVSCEATDAAGQTAACTASVTVLAPSPLDPNKNPKK